MTKDTACEFAVQLLAGRQSFNVVLLQEMIALIQIDPYSIILLSRNRFQYPSGLLKIIY